MSFASYGGITLVDMTSVGCRPRERWGVTGEVSKWEILLLLYFHLLLLPLLPERL